MTNWRLLIPVVICSILFFIIPHHEEPGVTLQTFYDANPQFLIYDCITGGCGVIWIIFMVAFISTVGIKKNHSVEG